MPCKSEARQGKGKAAQKDPHVPINGGALQLAEQARCFSSPWTNLLPGDHHIKLGKAHANKKAHTYADEYLIDALWGNDGHRSGVRWFRREIAWAWVRSEAVEAVACTRPAMDAAVLRVRLQHARTPSTTRSTASASRLVPQGIESLFAGATAATALPCWPHLLSSQFPHVASARDVRAASTRVLERHAN